MSTADLPLPCGPRRSADPFEPRERQASRICCTCSACGSSPCSACPLRLQDSWRRTSVDAHAMTALPSSSTSAAAAITLRAFSGGACLWPAFLLALPPPPPPPPPLPPLPEPEALEVGAHADSTSASATRVLAPDVSARAYA